MDFHEELMEIYSLFDVNNSQSQAPPISGQTTLLGPLDNDGVPLNASQQPCGPYARDRFDPDARRREKLERERVYARERRQKKADRLKYLEVYASELETHIVILKRRNAELERELMYRHGNI
jgi:hypothetical protein